MTKNKVQPKVKYKVDNKLNISWFLCLFNKSYIKNLQSAQNNEN